MTEIFLSSFAVNVVVGDNGSMWFWDWRSGHNFQQAQTIVQPGMSFSLSIISLLSYYGIKSLTMITILVQVHWIVKLVFMHCHMM